MGSDAVAGAELYAALAEALGQPPPWLAEAGRNWPLFEAAVGAAQHLGSETARRGAEALAAIPPEPLKTRRRRYRQLFAGPGRPRLWLYESMYVDGRLLGPVAFAVQRIYEAAGLEVEGAELPDHASLELAFLGWLAEQEAAHPTQAGDWQQLARRFMQRHAGRWLPDLGRALAASGDSVYAPIGQLLADWLTEAERPRQRGKMPSCPTLPAIPQTEVCALCGFCAQVCPTQALIVRETDAETGLVLIPSACVGCGKCERVCDFSALRLEEPSSDAAGPVALRVSHRAMCAGCGQPTVSRAELKAIAASIGEWPRWLDYCLECRPILMESV
ncbi:MAG: Selenate reductase assembly chaperone protein [Anaerolineales bacterium]|nr:Selenate reductase assembly chaperone protein [Anaerolineales bacterium]